MSNAPYLSLDVGLKRTGTALSESGMVARPLIVVQTDYPHLHNFLDAITGLIREHTIQTILVGLPQSTSGGDTPQSKKVLAIIEHLETELSKLPQPPTITFADESGSTRDAKQLYPELDDNLAAAMIILQDYLDSLV